MEVKIEDEKFCNKIFIGDVSSDDLKREFHNAYMKINKNVIIPGFRKGKAPISLIRNRYKQAVTDDLKDELPIKFFKDYATENNLVYFGDPRVKKINLDEEKGMKFSIIFESLPDLSNIE